MPSNVTDNPEEHRFELPLGEDAMAVAYYRVEDKRVVLTHTEVPYEYSGQGIGSRLAQGIFEIARRDGLQLVLRCPFLGGWFARHPEYGDVVAG